MKAYTRLTILLFIIFTFPVSAQVNKYDIGVEGGLNYIKLRGNTDVIKHHTRGSIGNSAGISMQYNFMKRFSIFIGAFHEKKTWVSEYSNPWYVTTKTTNIEYLTIPLLLKTFFDKKRLLYFNTGPHLGILLKYIETSNYRQEQNMFGRANRLDLGVMAGLGVNIPIKQKFKLTFEVRNYLGLNNIKKTPASEILKVNTTNLLIGFAYKFGNREVKQNNDSTQQKERKAFLKLFYAPQICYRKTNVERSYWGSKRSGYDRLSYNSNLEIPNFSYELGALVEFKMGNHFNINTGVTFDVLRFKTKIIDTLFWEPSIGLFGLNKPDILLDHPPMKYRYIYFSLPLVVNYQFKKNKVSYYAGTGASLSYLFRYTEKGTNMWGGEWTYNNHFIERQWKPHFDLFYIMNIGLACPLIGKKEFFIEPNFKYQITSHGGQVELFQRQLWSAGCRVGIKF
jgi:hypothetical protein